MIISPRGLVGEEGERADQVPELETGRLIHRVSWDPKSYAGPYTGVPGVAGRLTGWLCGMMAVAGVVGNLDPPLLVEGHRVAGVIATP